MTTAIAALPFYGGGTLACFDPSDSTVIESTSAGKYATTFSTCALSVPQNGTGATLSAASWASSPSWPVAATLWSHSVTFTFNTSVGGLEQYFCRYYNVSTEVARITFQNTAGVGPVYRLYTLQSGSLTLVGSAQIPFALQTMDVKLIGNTASGAASLYVAGTLAINGSSLNHSTWTGVTRIVLYGADSQVWWSQVACSATSTVGMFLKDDVLNANGATQQWTNGVSSINEIPTDDSTFIYVATSNQTSVFKASGLSLAGYVITGRGVGARMKIQGTNPPKIRLVIRSGATNFASTAIVAASNFQAAFNSWTTDPHTGIAWTATNAAVAQNGVQSSS